jgi:hypothetical protein
MTIPADLAISSTASIIYNNGFTTAHSSTLNFLKGLMIAYFEQLSRRAKEIPEKGTFSNKFQINDYLV